MANGKEPGDKQAQHARFIETARAIGCDESEEAFDEKLKAIARHKPNKAAEDGKPAKKVKEP